MSAKKIFDCETEVTLQYLTPGLIPGYHTEPQKHRIVVYNGFDLDIMNRHYNWIKKLPKDEVPIYMIFFIQDQLQINQYKSNRLDNKFCIAIILDKPRDEQFMLDYCDICFSDEYLSQKRLLHQMPIL